MGMFDKTYADLISRVRAICHLVGDVPYTDNDLLAIVRDSIGEVFLSIPLFHEKFWSSGIGVSTAINPAARDFSKPDDCWRIIRMQAVEDETSDVAYDFLEASLNEVDAEYRRDVDGDDPLEMETQNLFADIGNKIFLTKVCTFATLYYIYDPVKKDMSATTASIASCPSALHMPVILLASSLVDAHTNAERSVGLERRARALLGAYLQGENLAQQQAISRRVSYVNKLKSTTIRVNDY